MFMVGQVETMIVVGLEGMMVIVEVEGVIVVVVAVAVMGVEEVMVTRLLKRMRRKTAAASSIL